MPDVSTLYIRVDSKQVKVGTVSLAALGKQAGVTAGQIDKTTVASKNLAGRQKVTASELSSSFKVIGRDLSRYVTLPFLAASAASLKFSKDLTTGLGQVETLISGTGSRIYELQDLVTSVSSDTGVGFENLNRGLYETISAFQDGADTAGRFGTAAKASVAGSADVLDSVTLLSAVTKAYGDTSEEAAEKVADLAFAAVKYGQTTFKDLATAIQGVTANSNRLGVSQEELFSVYSTLTGVTGDAANVTTQFNRALLSLSNPTKDLQALFAQYRTEQDAVVTTGKEFIEVTGGAVQAFKAIYDNAQKTGQPLEKFITRQTGVIAVTALANQQFDVFIKKSSLVADSVGAMEDAYYAAITGVDEFQRILKQTKQTLATAGAEIGQTLLPVIVVITKSIAEAAERFTELDAGAQKTIISLFGIAAALGPVLIMVGSVLRVVKLFGSLKLLSSVGALGALSPAVLAGVATAILIVSLAMGKWIKQIKLQVQALQSLRTASLGFNDANTEFMTLIANTSDMSGVAERNDAVITELSKTYGDEFAGSLEKSTTSLNDIYQEMLKIEAFNFQKELGVQTEQFDVLQGNLQGVASSVADASNKMKQRFPEIFETYRGNLAQASKDWENSAGLFSMDKVFESDNQEATKMRMESMMATILKSMDLQSEFEKQEGNITQFLDDLQADIEKRTGGMLSLQRLFDEFGVEYTSDILVIPKGTFKEAGTDAGAEFTEGFGDSGKRLKTWEDYFSEIADVAGQAFAKIEYDTTGNIAGFTSGSGEKAAEAYINAFRQNITNSKVIAEAIGQSFSAEDALAIVENQMDNTVNVLSELLDIAARDVAGGVKGVFQLKDALGELSSGELDDLYEKFNLTDKSLQGLINHITDLQSVANSLSVETIEDELESVIAGIDIDSLIADQTFGDFFKYDEAQVTALQESLKDLYEIKALIAGEGVISPEDEATLSRINGLINKVSYSLGVMTNSYARASAVLKEFGSIGEAVQESLYSAIQTGLVDIGMSFEKSQTAAVALTDIITGTMDALFDSLSNVAYGFGMAAAGIGDMNDALGEAALSIAKTVSQLAIAAGLQLIIQGNTGLGLGLLFGGLAGQTVLGFVEGTIQKEKEANAQGGVYSGSQKLTEYAHGGVLGNYVNSIVDKPTYFANGSAVMGEAGAEAIMPLTRDSNGDLAVSAVGAGGGGSASVSININNYASDSTTATATQNTDGSIDVNIMKKMVASAIADGSTDRAMQSRYGTKVRGIN